MFEQLTTRLNSLKMLIIFIWAVFALSDKDEREVYFEKTFKILTNPSDLDDYPHEYIEKMLESVKYNLLFVPKWLISRTLTFIHQVSGIGWQKIFGQGIALLFSFVFLVADGVVATQFLEIKDYSTESLPAWAKLLLGQYSIAVTSGSVLAIIVGTFILFEALSSSEAEHFTDYSRYSGPIGKIIKRGAAILVGLGLLVGGLLGVPLIAEQIVLPSWVDVLVTVIIEIVIRINVLLASLLLAPEAIKGFRIFLVFLGIGVFIISGVLYTLLGLWATLFRIFLDWTIRFIRWLLWTASFFIWNPIDRITKFLGL